jgi:hypothetical protein
MNLDPYFSIILSSDLNYEALIAEISADGKLVAIVSQERGLGIFEIETPGASRKEDQVCRTVNLKAFLEAIELACIRLVGEVE